MYARHSVTQPRAQRSNVGLGPGTLGDDEGGQRIHFSVADDRQDDCSPDAFERAEVRLDVAELDAVAVQLHLVIAPAIEEHQAVLDVPDVASPVRALPVEVHEALRREVGPLEIPGLTLSPAMMISPRWPSGSGSRLPSATTNTAVPGLGYPTGNTACRASNSVVTWTEVATTVASVGPYMFQTSAPGNLASNWRAISGARVSPAKRKRRTSGSIRRSNRGSARQIRAKEGVETQTVTPGVFQRGRTGA